MKKYKSFCPHCHTSFAVITGNLSSGWLTVASWGLLQTHAILQTIMGYSGWTDRFLLIKCLFVHLALNSSDARGGQSSYRKTCSLFNV